jgi:glycosyltransferase involved in cell wall biosynthesis
MSGSSAAISAVLPTYNRLAALHENFGSLLELAGVSEIVVVDDGSTDGTAEWLDGLADPRVRPLHQTQQGSPAARNAGVAAAHGDWILMTEDDCWLPAEFAVTLLDVAQARDAQIVSAPWLPVGGREEIPAALERGRRNARARIGLRTHPSVFPSSDLQTPFLNGIVLARRDVLRTIRYDESLRGTAWREETSLFLTATERGFRCVLTPRTASFQLGQWDGGQRRPRVSYEAWAVRNNWRFLRRHATTLRRMGEIRSPAGAQAQFVADRLRAVVGGYASARGSGALDRIRRRGIRSDVPGGS